MSKLFIKVFNKEEYAKSLLKNGELLFRQIKHFATTADKIRYDECEGKETFMFNTKFIDEKGNLKIKIFNPSNSRTFIEIEKSLNNLAGYVSTHYKNEVVQKKKIVRDKDFTGLIYCMSAINTAENYVLDIQKFGDYAVIINNTEEFISRIKKYCVQNNLTEYDKKVEYVDNEVSYHLIFRKQSYYKGENEYRFVIEGLTDEQKLISIGDISDIAQMVSTRELCRLLNKQKFF